MEDSESSFSDWESINDDGKVPGETTKQKQVVLELPPEVFNGGVTPSPGTAAVAAAAAKSPGSDGSAACTSMSSFEPVYRLDNMSMNSTETSTASAYNYKSTSEDSSVLSNFEILSLSSGVVQRCKRCKFHNTHDSVVCACCALALVANPNVSIDAQIALHLQQKEEQNALAVLQEAERKRNQLHQDPLYEPARILTDDIKRACNSFQTLPKEDLERLALGFVQRAMDLPEPKSISFSFKCTPRTSLEHIRIGGLPRDQHLGMNTCKVEFSDSLEGALASFNTVGMMQGRPLCPIPENDIEQLNPGCLCWVVAIVQSTESTDNRNACSPDQTLPFIYFDSSRTDVGNFGILLHNLRLTFLDFFVASLDLPISLSLPPPKKKTKQYHGTAGISFSSSSSKESSNETCLPKGSSDDMESEFEKRASMSSELAPIPSTSANTSPEKLSFDTAESRKPLTTCNFNKETRSLKMKDRITVVEAFDTSLAICCDDQYVLLWNEQSGVHKTLKGASDRISCMTSVASTMRNGHFLASGDVNGGVVVYTLGSGSSGEICDDITAVIGGRQSRGDEGAYKFCTANFPAIMDLCFLPKRTALAATNSRRECRLWSLKDNSCMCSLKGERPEPLCNGCGFQLMLARFCPEGNSLASVVEGSRFIHFWKFNGERQQLTGHESSLDIIGRQEFRIRALCFSADGKYLASTANDCTIRLWEIQNDDSPCTKIIHAPVAITSLAFSPDSMLIAGGCVDGSIRVWNVLSSSDVTVQNFFSKTGTIKSLLFLPDGKTLVSVMWSDCALRFWNLGL